MEPILPMRLFKGRVFTMASILSFIVGFGMMGSITFLPTFMQFVGGASATSSGLRMLPMVIGLLLTAIASGAYVGRTGKYRMFPIAGSAVMAVGLFLLSRLDADTGVIVETLYLFVLGAGIGLIMQILTLIVQNTADYRDLGTATSGVTFFRTLGGAFGAAVLGSIYSNQLADSLPVAIVASGVSPEVATNPAALHALPDAVKAPVVAAYADALHNVFLWAIPVALLALVAALFLPQVKLRDGNRPSGTGEGFAVPEGAAADTQLENVISEVLRRNARAAAPSVLARSGTAMDIPMIWGVLGVYLREEITTAPRQVDIERRVGIPAGVLTSFYDGIVDAGYVRRDGELLRLTDPGRAEVEMISTAVRAWVREQLADWLPADAGAVEAEQIDAALDRIVVQIVREDALRDLTAMVAA